MARKIYVKRYAQAVFELALEKNEPDRWLADLQKLAGARRDVTLMAALASPKIRLEVKSRMLTERVTGISPLAMNLAGLLISRGRFEIISDITEEYRRMIEKHRGIEQAEVITAIPLDDAEKQMLAERFAALTGKQIVLKPEVDAGVLGGLVVKVGGKLLDGSTRHRLAGLKKALAGAG